MLSEMQTPRKRGIVSQLKLGKRNDSVRDLGPHDFFGGKENLLGVGKRGLKNCCIGEGAGLAWEELESFVALKEEDSDLRAVRTIKTFLLNN